MAALIQTLPQQTNTATMLQTRTTSTNGMLPSSHGQTSPQYMGGSSQAPRSAYQSAGNSGYRANAAQVQPYAFTNPNLNQNMQWQQQYGAYRTNSSPAVPMVQNYNSTGSHSPRFQHQQQQQQSTSMASYGYNPAIGVGQSGSRDDSAIPPSRNTASAARPQSAYLSGSTQQFSSTTASSKTAPDRYRRTAPAQQQQQQNHHNRSQSTTLPTVGMPTANQLYNGPNVQRSAVPNRPSSFYGGVPNTSMDDMILYRQAKDDSSRVRRRSMRGIESPDARSAAAQDKAKAEKMKMDKAAAAKSNGKDSQSLKVASHVSAHSRNASSESINSSRSSHSRPGSSANRNASVSTAAPSSPASDDTSVKQDQGKQVNVPPRGSSTDAAKRTLNPSPLSRPATMANDKKDSQSPAKSYAAAAASNLETPAAKHLAALSKGGKNKNKSSRLRRAFSFGSAADFRKAAGPDVDADKNDPSKLNRDPADEAYDAEQARIAEAQEAAGIGNSIYGSRFFGGSTDNLSISSTASSASVMIRKMGRGMKKSGRSFVGLFRPKSVIGVPAADGPIPEGSQAAVSMITAEAESRRVNVSPDPKTSDGFPHLERNSIDTNLGAEIAQSLGAANDSRRSIVGGDKERAEVLAAVRKGILKRPGSSSPSSKPVDASPGLDLPGVPAIADSPNSSAPSTPNDDQQRRNGSIAVGTEDYFTSALRLRQDTKSAPGTPSGNAKRNATFSPRLIFYDTWPSQEYDRRGDVATCNRLTPMLAQQIKEELNTFKMEMEVHENSKIYTHFF